MSFQKGFEKVALSRQKMRAASTQASNAADLVATVADKLGVMPGPAAAKFGGQAVLFNRGARSKSLAQRAHARIHRRNGAYSGHFFKHHLGSNLGLTQFKTQDVLNILRSPIKKRSKISGIKIPIKDERSDKRSKMLIRLMERNGRPLERNKPTDNQKKLTKEKIKNIYMNLTKDIK